MAKSSQRLVKAENSVQEIVITNGKKNIQIKDGEKKEINLVFNGDIRFLEDSKVDLIKDKHLGIRENIFRPIML